METRASKRGQTSEPEEIHVEEETQVESEGQRHLENINNERFLSDGTDSDSSDDTVKSYNRQATTPVSNTCNTNASALHDLERRMNQLESELKERIIGMRTEFKTMQETELSIKGQAEYITFLKSQNERLVMENRELQEKSFNLSYIVSDLNTKLKEAENDKLSLVTAIKILQTEIPENAANNHTKAGNTKATGQKETFDGDIRLVYASKPMPAVETRNRYSVLSDVVAKPSESDASSSEFIEPEKSKTASGMSGQRVNGKNRKSRTTVIISDSMTKHIDVQRLERSVRGSKVRLETCSGANVEAISHHVQPCLKKKPDDLIIHVGTNDLKAKSSSDVANEIINLCTAISETHPSTRINISEIITRTDQIDLVPKIRE
ncbi:Hypothetical predicted protein, partial [Paramuricea clavata]